MEDKYLNIISDNIKSIRQRKKLSLEKASKTTGVSKSMIAQIERREVNPTVTILGKIAEGFGVSLMDILYIKQPDFMVTSKGEISPDEEDYGRIKIYKTLPFDTGRRFEQHMIEVESGGSSGIKNNPENSRTYLMVLKGNLNFTLEDSQHNLSSGDMVQYTGNTKFSYVNSGKKSCRMSLIIHYPNK